MTELEELALEIEESVKSLRRNIHSGYSAQVCVEKLQEIRSDLEELEEGIRRGNVETD